jgi:hypothetical protein
VSDILFMKIGDFGPGRSLTSFLSPYHVDQLNKECVELTLCRHRWQMPNLEGERIAGNYKGVPWKVTFDRDGRGQVRRIFFYATSFVTFLLLRIVLIPMLKLALIEKGGFLLFGSVFYYHGTTFILIGQPGTNKTSLTLKALEKGAELVADNGLLIMKSGIVKGLGNEIELRYHTARGTPFWPILSFDKKLYLSLCQLLSFLSSHYISFNLTLPSSRLGIERRRDSPENNHAAILLTIEPRSKRLGLESFIGEIISLERWYQRIFGNIFSLDPVKEEARVKENMRSFFLGRPLWRFRRECAVEEILSLTRSDLLEAI